MCYVNDKMIQCPKLTQQFRDLRNGHTDLTYFYLIILNNYRLRQKKDKIFGILSFRII